MPERAVIRVWSNGAITVSIKGTSMLLPARIASLLLAPLAGLLIKFVGVARKNTQTRPLIGVNSALERYQR